MGKKIRDYIRGCRLCQEAKARPPHLAASPLRMTVAERPGDLWTADFAGPLLVTKAGNRYWLAVGDAASGRHELVPLRSLEAKEVVRAFTQIFDDPSWLGPPRVIRTAHDSPFISAAFERMCKMRGIVHELVPPNHSDGLGMTEHLHRTVEERLRPQIANGQQWDVAAPRLVREMMLEPHPPLHIPPLLRFQAGHRRRDHTFVAPPNAVERVLPASTWQPLAITAEALEADEEARRHKNTSANKRKSSRFPSYTQRSLLQSPDADLVHAGRSWNLLTRCDTGRSSMLRVTEVFNGEGGTGDSTETGSLMNNCTRMVRSRSLQQLCGLALQLHSFGFIDHEPSLY
jgi:transposase InsO family protein